MSENRTKVNGWYFIRYGLRALWCGGTYLINSTDNDTTYTAMGASETLIVKPRTQDNGQ